MLNHFATIAGTTKYTQRYPELFFQPLGKTGLAVSGAGFGGYRVDVSFPTHCQALAKALCSGINLIDTSPNYADGGSERLVGKVLSELVVQGQVERDEIIIVSKVGYLQGENYRLSQDRRASGQPFPELVLYEEGLEHCIHPQFLADQLSRSLDRMGLETIDCYLLHNPEYYLKWAERSGIPYQEAQAEYLRRIGQAFAYLEEEVAQGRIGCYGISSNTFAYPKDHYTSTSLAPIWELAQNLDREHHFRIIQLPCNLFETGAITEGNQPSGDSVIEFASKQGMAVLINRPLNAIQGNELIRLSEKVYQGQAAKEATAFCKQIAGLEPDWQDVRSLSQLALRALRSTKGVTAVLVGMRQTAYVEDVLQELQQPCAVAERKNVWESIKDGRGRK